jgi:hypothetical protein
VTHRSTLTADLQPNGDCRCSCHRLLARVVAEGIELRCPRCKSNVLLPRAFLIDALRREPDRARSS